MLKFGLMIWARVANATRVFLFRKQNNPFNGDPKGQNERSVAIVGTKKMDERSATG